MARELNRELFGSIRDQNNSGMDSAPVPLGQFAKSEEVRIMGMQVEHLSKRLKEFESRLEVMTSRTDEMINTNKQRFERVQGHFKNQNEQIQNGVSDLNAKLAQVVSRVNERKVSENVIKEMVERQASLVQTFEVRMQQLQRVISEQELQLMNARTELREAVQEIARLKKL